MREMKERSFVSVTLPGGRKARLAIEDDMPEVPREKKRRRLPWSTPLGTFQMTAAIQVESRDPLSSAEKDALTCSILNLAAKRRRSLGCDNPYQHLGPVFLPAFFDAYFFEQFD